MKRISKKVISAIMCFLIFAVPSFAENVTNETTEMAASWEIDYSVGAELAITFKSPALYNQRVVVILYDADVTNPGINDVKRMSSLFVSGGVETTVKFKIGNDLNEADGRYKVKIQGNGYLAEQSSKVLDVSLLTPAKADDLLLQINQETTTEGTTALLVSGKDTLQISLAPEPAKLEKTVAIFLENKSLEEDGKFKNLNAVRDAWHKAEIIAYLQSDDANVDGLKALSEKNATLLGLDISDSDYIEKRDIAYSKATTYKNSYCDTGIRDCGTLVKSIRDFVAVEVINESSMDFVEISKGNYQIELEAAVIKHKDALGISDEYFNKFSSFSDTNRQKVIRLIHNKNFTFSREIVSAFNYGVDNITEVEVNPDKPSDNDSYGGGSIGGGGSSGGGAFGGSLIATDKKEEENQQQVPVTKKFADVSTEHWAYSYIDSLSETGVISGYQDGEFKPDNYVNREEFLKMVVLVAELYDDNTECEFNDVDKNAWYYRYVASAKSVNLVNGISTDMFGVGTSITREDAAVIISRCIDIANKKSKTDVSDTKTEFTDDEDISEYAKTGIKRLGELGIINGFEDNSFRPKNFITRAQAAKIIKLLSEVIA